MKRMVWCVRAHKSAAVIAEQETRLPLITCSAPSGGMSSWHVWVCLVYVLWFGLHFPGFWDRRAAVHNSALTLFSNRPGPADLKALVALGGRVSRFSSFCRLHFLAALKQTRGPNGVIEFCRFGLLYVKLVVIYSITGMRCWRYSADWLFTEFILLLCKVRSGQADGVKNDMAKML